MIIDKLFFFLKYYVALAYPVLHYHMLYVPAMPYSLCIMDGATPSGSVALQLAQLWGAKV